MHSKPLLVYSAAIFMLMFCSCRALQFYGEPDKPFFYSPSRNIAAVEDIDSVNVVTFNIKKARKISLAISEMQALDKKKRVDVYLLQEMDEKGVEQMAEAMHLNYLYIPIAYDRGDKKNIGNAILTKGTIANPEKLILPHAKWQNQQRRDVTIGEVTLHQKKILVLSIHTETLMMPRRDRMDQVDSIIARAKALMPHYKYVIAGGDFNTVLPKDVQLVSSRFRNAGFDWVSSNVGSTAKGMLGLVKPKNDYIFSKGFHDADAFTVYSSRASDHFPVFATVDF